MRNGLDESLVTEAKMRAEPDKMYVTWKANNDGAGKPAAVQL